MRVRSPQDYSHVAPLGCPVEKGEVVEVDDELGVQLVAQGWSKAGRATTSPPRPKAALGTPRKAKAKPAPKTEPAPATAPTEE